MNFNDVGIVSIKGSDYRISTYFWYMSKDDAIRIMNNFFSLYIKVSETTYCQRNRETILNRVKEYYENDKERLSEEII